MGHEADRPPDNYQVRVAHPGAVNTTYAMVASLAERSLLARFDTGFYCKEQQWSWLLNRLPPRLAARALRELKRRHAPGMPEDRIYQHPLWEILCIAAPRLGLSSRWLRALRDHRNARFDRLIAGSLSRQGRRGAAPPDLLVVQDGSALQSLEAARRQGIPTVLNQVIGHYLHGREILLEEEARFPKLKGRLVMPRSADFLASVAREPAAADWILAPSDYVTETVVAQGARRQRVLKLPYCVDTARFQAGPDKAGRKGPCRLLFVGQISQRKGLLYLLEALKQLNDPALELTLVGTIEAGAAGGAGGKTGDWLADYEDCFTALANVPYSEVHALYRQADIFVYPSLHEGSPMAIFEAMASGLPVITTANAGSVVRDGEDGFLLPIRDVEGLKEKIILLKDDPGLCQTMGQAARKAAEDYAPSRYGDRLLGCLATIARGREPEDC